MPNPEQSPTLLSLRAIRLDHAALTVLRMVNFAAHAGERVALLGKNGAGKTSLLRAMAGIMPPTEGDVLAFGQSYAKARAQILPRIGYLPENLALPLEWRVDDFLWAHAQLYGLAATTAKARLTTILARPAWRPVLTQRIASLSKGWRRRIAWAALLAQRPELWLLDEPTDGLDPIETAEFMTRLATQTPAPSWVLSTHDLTLAQRYCSRWVVLHQGAVMYDGPAPSGDAAAFFRDCLMGTGV